MAHRVVPRIIRNVFADAWKDAKASQKYASAAAQGRIQDNTLMAHHKLTLGEACQILNVKPPQGGRADTSMVMDRFKRLFDANEPEKGGSFYLQSKVLRARERIEAEIRDAEVKAARDEVLENGWKPKLYRR